MRISRSVLLSLVVLVGTAAAYAIGRRTRRLARCQLKEGLCTWEDEGGNLAPPADLPIPPVTPVQRRLASNP